MGALQCNASIKRLETRFQGHKESAVLLGHRPNSCLQSDGETAILMAGDQRALSSLAGLHRSSDKRDKLASYL